MPILTEDSPARRDPGWARIAYEYCLYFLFIGRFALFGLSMTALFLVAGWIIPARARGVLGRRLLHRFFRRYFESAVATRSFVVDLPAIDALRDAAPMVIVANHPALLDAMFFAARLENVVGIMKADVRLNPLFGGAALMAGYVRADRPLEMMRAMHAALRNDTHVLVFPEGTRTVESPINPFKGNFALIAKQADVPIQTVFIETDSPFLGKGWSLFRKPPMPIVYRLRLGKRFAPNADVKQQVRDIEAYFRAELAGSNLRRP